MRLGSLVAVLVLLALAGCTSAQPGDVADPNAGAESAPGSGAVPKASPQGKVAIARIPPPAPAATDKPARAAVAPQVAEGLVADKARASYTDDEVKAKPAEAPQPKSAEKAAKSPPAVAAAKPVPPVPQQMAQAAPQAAPQSAQQAEPTVALQTAPTASEKGSAIRVRFGEHGEYSRMVFDWPGEPKYKIEAQSRSDGDWLLIKFEQPTSFMPTMLSKKPIRHFHWHGWRASSQGTVVVVQATKGAGVREMRLEGRVVIDVASPAGVSLAPKGIPPAFPVSAADVAPPKAPAPAPVKAAQAAAPTAAPAAAPPKVAAPKVTAPAPKADTAAASPAAPPSPPQSSPPQPSPPVAPQQAVPTTAQPAAPQAAAQPDAKRAGLGRVATVFFGGDGALDSQGKATVDQVAATVRSRGGSVRLVGYPSNVESAGGSAVSRMQKLAGAFKLAQSVANELIGRGIDPQSILVEAKAESEQNLARTEVFLEN